MNLFQYNSQELLLHIRQELEQNPFLEEVAEHKEDGGSEEYNREAAADYKDWDEYADNDVPDYKVEYANYFNESDMPERPLAAQVDFVKKRNGNWICSICQTEKLLLAIT